MEDRKKEGGRGWSSLQPWERLVSLSDSGKVPVQSRLNIPEKQPSPRKQLKKGDEGKGPLRATAGSHSRALTTRLWGLR